ncbi:SDR family NAD(P)-dependent oxidoreductase [Lentilactobacillus hilgardii]|uniref:Oxidoreductase, short chain dehydrogenase/reductase family protein n=1 Tax=Lentilactobacillus hilgardii (strain ATCC 8290 / DSM 20176 / CCUG 30140 / JCM 1155 / KCTC 3500 / NBRC 15886 / NCIMB 8040 / NRRL B-1843 / 9) TaxID=1423757 RepID=C0XL31_LENH9|nr:SDR family NAD(P)-dependent oxidoreductase [Lentilactobacillus hilgardii]EEI23776.1 oxidoreductase, short chain dehydrogenase/reductase family protein [Lentilactobacillus hilgardii DSM 20176 = ATCC 8290]KRK59208.1 short-chain dehydrogenase reductase SDR [Lentilactobacillus hilgardii DSM 20176 = ATCC 8290]MCP9332679.1 SDR family NAD(P)-dependent oxidoreductase [Lentilactobacillus hilgardii]MCP9349257.1 SDR family NAD(P)-dependent oxidoreductase [Lentilactobacillus hilgardii]MCP9352126.1 SDR 
MVNKAFVTGANRGIGFEIAKQLAEHGYFVIVGARRLESGQQAVNKLVEAGISALQLDTIQIDLTESQSITEAADKISRQHPDLNLLVNNAGIAGDMAKPALETTVADYQQTLNVNLFGTFQVIQKLVPILKNNHGRIANLTGPFSATLWYNPAAYRVSKIALNGLIQTLAVDFINQKLPLSIFGIFPGGVSTDINGHRQGPFMKTVEEGGQLVTNILLDGQSHNGDIVGPNGHVLSTVDQ